LTTQAPKVINQVKTRQTIKTNREMRFTSSR